MTRTRPGRPSGFTLVELMIVVAIIGVLSSVALPTFKTFSLRAKQSERRLVLKTIKQSAEDIYVRYNRIEDGAGNALPVLVGAQNPSGAPTTTRRPYNPAAANWSYLGVTDQFIEGMLYYTYQFWIFDVPGTQQLYLLAQGDLDGDNRYSFKYQVYDLREQAYTLFYDFPVNTGAALLTQDVDSSGVPTW